MRSSTGDWLRLKTRTLLGATRLFTSGNSPVHPPRLHRGCAATGPAPLCGGPGPREERVQLDGTGTARPGEHCTGVAIHRPRRSSARRSAAERPHASLPGGLPRPGPRLVPCVSLARPVERRAGRLLRGTVRPAPARRGRGFADRARGSCAGLARLRGMGCGFPRHGG
jgi:hypothetical protein